ncbi:MAG: site-specific DNA-methyltransferase, partial [Leptospiraceae bacterium]|nr:site-specific DNA-methyltransferase [Leptospiraceae bacterium]
VPEEVVKDSVYKLGNHYYITDSERITQTDFQKIVKQAHSNSGKIFVDGWTASLNATLQHYKEDVKIVF